MRNLVNALFNLFRTKCVEDWEIDEIAIHGLRGEARENYGKYLMSKI